MYAKTIRSTLINASLSFPVVLVTGPRQVGKTTLLETSSDSDRNYVTLDDFEARTLAQNDPALFFQRYQPPLTIDEIQYAPELFSTIKIMVDRAQTNGLFWLTGSQRFHLMQNITESLAGRVAIIELNGFAKAEIEQRAEDLPPFLPTKEWIEHARSRKSEPILLKKLYQNIWQGSYPRVITHPDISSDLFYNSYLQTYIQRDVREIVKVTNEMVFRDFIGVVAARTAQLLNYADLARDVGIDQKTVKAWLSVLESSGLIYLLTPYHNNMTKRVIKTPKLYFLDTGLCRYLTKWSTPEALEAGAFSGAILESYLISETLKSYWYNGLTPNFYFYRDKDQKEIDLLIEKDDILYPVEIKKTATPSLNTAKHFSVLKKLGKDIGHGAVICLKESDIPLSAEISVIPISYL
ncbi:MAG: ATP-binding protein [Sedimenticola sp.]